MSLFIIFTLILSGCTMAADYSAERISLDGLEVIRLGDTARKIEVSIVPAIGNNAFEMKVNGRNILWSPYQNLQQWLEKPTGLGNPFLAPWANRIDGNAYWAGGKRYHLNPELGNFRFDANQQPIHGLVFYTKDWKVVRLEADQRSAQVTSRLEFWRRPDWMAQFPYAHNYEMTYRLQDGVLEVETAIENISSESMPLSLGYHTYYRVDDSPRSDWSVRVAARDHMILSDKLIPTGEKRPVNLADPQPIRGIRLDDVFTNLIRDPAGRAEFRLQGRSQKVRVLFGPRYDVAIVFSPQDREFVCFEPMVGLTNAFNLAQAGIYKGLQTVPPSGTWRESFWIIPEGF